MPTARDSLLDSALAALALQAWPTVRMVDVALAAGVSRQTLYNEFGSKEGLARALVRRETEAYLAGVERALAAAERSGADAGDCFAAAAAWTLRTARRNPLIRAALTGCRNERLPQAALPAPRSGDRASGAVTSTDLVVLVRERAVGALEHGYPTLDLADIASACEAAVRLTLSYVVAPAASADAACSDVARLGRALLARRW